MSLSGYAFDAVQRHARLAARHARGLGALVARHARGLGALAARHARGLGALAVLVSALCSGTRTAAQEVASSAFATAGARGLAERVATLDAELAALQTHTRRYFAGWLVANSLLASAQVAIALTSHSDVVRTNYLVGAGLSAAGGVMLVAQPWPGFSAHDHYRAVPHGSPRLDIAKIDYGEALRARQRRADRSAITPIKHGIAAVVALGSGIRAGMSFSSPYQGVFRGLFVLTVLELQILTRPRNVLAARSDLDKNPRWLWSAGPWLDARSYGAQLSARF